jgi:hypothetical protein
MADLTAAGILVQQCAGDLFAERQRCKLIIPFPRDELVAAQLEIFREYAKRAKELGLGVAPSDLMMFGYSVHAALAELERAS